MSSAVVTRVPLRFASDTTASLPDRAAVVEHAVRPVTVAATARVVAVRV